MPANIKLPCPCLIRKSPGCACQQLFDQSDLGLIDRKSSDTIKPLQIRYRPPQCTVTTTVTVVKRPQRRQKIPASQNGKG